MNVEDEGEKRAYVAGNFDCGEENKNYEGSYAHNGCKDSQNTRKNTDRTKINVTSSNRKTAANKISVVSIFRFMLWISSGLYSILFTNSWARIRNKSAAS